MSDDTEPNEQTYTLRFKNSRTTDLLFGIEPYGLYYYVPPTKLIEIVFTPYENYKHTTRVKEDGSLVFEVIGNVTVYLDGEEVHS